MDVSGGRGPVDYDARVRLPGGASPSFLLWGDDARLWFGGVDDAEQLLCRAACARSCTAE